MDGKKAEGEAVFLHEASVADLLDELTRRYSVTIFAAEGEGGGFMDFRGSKMAALGLTVYLGELIKAKLREDTSSGRKGS